MPAPASADPAERYRTALTCLDAGDEAGARRAVEEGLACSWQPCAAGTRECLDDLASQLDGEAALHRFAGRTPGPRGWLARPDDLARDVLALRRAHLVEAVIEEVALVLPPPVLLRLVGALGRAGTSAARDLLAACSAVLPGRAAHAARQHWGGCRPASPAVMSLARAACKNLEASTVEAAMRGAYKVFDSAGAGAGEGAAGADCVVIATGTEVEIALAGARALAADTGKRVAVVSAPCLEVFAEQPAEYQRSLLPPGASVVSIEASAVAGWEKYAHAWVGLQGFGLSAPGPDVYKALNITAEAVAAKGKALMAHYGNAAPAVPAVAPRF